MNKFKRPARADQAGDEVIVYRPSRVQIALPAASAIVVATLLLYLGLLFTEDPLPAGDLGKGLLLALIAGAACFVLPRPKGVQATRSALVVGRSARGRIPWADVVAIQVGPSIFGRRVVVALKDGRRFTLAAPLSLLDREFDQKAEGLIARWESHRKRKR
ncbi:hypothetical protein [Streptomyces albipurpureus]|uniref:PH domain-containing protein n=1 Tax=Streptomyces albipurpureus TaxID=2897419 RepID=A0ABT0UHW3_9ACTN|nr:hypothetical protein [Streptomyces sp. CWNU-1]MCM2388034.1 hypothetical protein [Streptomyces sp. CWNU-1]